MLGWMDKQRNKQADKMCKLIVLGFLHMSLQTHSPLSSPLFHAQEAVCQINHLDPFALWVRGWEVGDARVLLPPAS